ncbi:hypothetical protein AHAS_Ahas10G0089800 [Arachis hypogaea]
MSSSIAGNELICRFRLAPDAIRLASLIRHSSGLTFARFQPLAGADSPAEACAPFLLEAIPYTRASPYNHSHIKSTA